MAVKVTICVPFYNVEPFFERCIRSLFEQTYDDLEYIFVDDGSPDNCIKILNETQCDYPERIPHVQIIRHEKNRGISAARNTAVAHCHTDFLLHVDSDDFLETDAVEKLVREQQKDDYDIVTGNGTIFYEDRTEVLRNNEHMRKDQLIKEYIKPTFNHVLWGRLIRTTLYTNNHLTALEGYDIGEDHQVVPCLFYYAQKVSSINDCIYNYNRMNSQSYMAQILLEENFSNWLVHELKAFEILHDFFFHRGEQDYCRSVAIELANLLYKATPAFVIWKQKKEFHFAWSYFYRISNKYKGVTPKNIIEAFVKRNYYLYSFVRAVRYGSLIKNFWKLKIYVPTLIGC